MEGVLAIIFLFGVPGIIGLSFTPLGKAVTERIRHGVQPRLVESDPAVYEELDSLRQEVSERAERLDFAERLLAKGQSTVDGQRLVERPTPDA
jgi:hypothetical protein